MALKTPDEESMERGITAAKAQDYVRAVEIFSRVYEHGFDKMLVDGVSYYGVALAAGYKRFREAVELCKNAIRIQPANPRHYTNLAQVYVIADNRKKAIDSLQEGIERLPGNRVILAYWRVLGMRARPAIPFLSRDNPLNKAIGKRRREKVKPPKKT